MTRLSALKETPSQTAGPYVHIGCTPDWVGIGAVYPADLGRSMVNPTTKGARITITGRVIDGTGAPLKDALLEIWQADADGIYPGGTDPRGAGDPAFAGFGRSAVDLETGEYRFETIKPGPVPFPDGRMQAPHLNIWIVARGINLGLNTRLYFPDEAAANAADPVLARIEPRQRVETLIATAAAPGQFRFDIRLQGEGETVFFDL